MDFLLNLISTPGKFLLTILSFNFIIIIHELGHFIVAKLSNVYVKEFSLFVGPKIFSIKRGETEYSLRTIPVAAYVKMEGEEEQSDSLRSFGIKPVWQRAAIIFAGPFANIISAVFAFAMLFLTTGVTTMQISEVDKASPAYNAGIQPGDTLLAYDGNRVYTPIDLLIFSKMKGKEPVYLQLNRDGKTIDRPIYPELNHKQYKIGVGFGNNPIPGKLIIQDINPSVPAAKAGLLAGDQIISINGKPVKTVIEMREIVNAAKGSSVKIEFDRKGKILDVSVKPYEESNPNETYLGFDFVLKENPTFLEASSHAVVFAYSNVKNVGHTLWWLVRGQAQVKDLSGPVGIVASMNQAISRSIDFKEIVISFLYTFAIISVAIGGTNLVPFPPLDGSKLLLLTFEAIRRKPLPVEKEAALSIAGMCVLLAFAVLVTYYDIVRVFLSQ